jgi:hypothetical protein
VNSDPEIRGIARAEFQEAHGQNSKTTGNHLGFSWNPDFHPAPLPPEIIDPEPGIIIVLNGAGSFQLVDRDR